MIPVSSPQNKASHKIQVLSPVFVDSVDSVQTAHSVDGGDYNDKH